MSEPYEVSEFDFEEFRTPEEWEAAELERVNRLGEYFAKNGVLVGEPLKPPPLQKNGALK